LPEGARLYSFSVTCGPLASGPNLSWLAPRGDERWSGPQNLRFKLAEGDFSRLEYALWVSGDGGVTWKSVRTEGATRPAGQEESWSWSSSSVPAGTYQFRLDALDRSRAPAPVVASLVSRPVVVSNTPPRLSIVSREPWKGVAMASAVAVVEVSYRSGGSPWLPAHPVDGLFDSPREEFEIFRTGSLEVRVRDEAGQETVQSF
jgi:hypothetical protein